MKINPNDPAMPCEVLQEFPNANNEFLVQHPGMDIRTKLAESAMVALIGVYGSSYMSFFPNRQNVAYMAMEMADLLINVLNEDK